MQVNTSTGDFDLLGESLIAELERAGWIVHRRLAFAGTGILLLIEHPAVLVPLWATGPTLASAAVTLFPEAVKFKQIPA